MKKRFKKNYIKKGKIKKKYNFQSKPKKNNLDNKKIANF